MREPPSLPDQSGPPDPPDAHAPPAEHAPEPVDTRPAGLESQAPPEEAGESPRPPWVATGGGVVPARRPPPPRPAPARRRGPSRSPFRAAVHSHVWLGVIVLTLTGAAAFGYWAARVHERIDGATLERAIAEREAAPTTRCVELQSNGAVWACGLVYNAQSVCLLANVNIVGDWSTTPGDDSCSHSPELVQLVPDPVRATQIAADLGRQFPGGRWICSRLFQAKVRWACARPDPSGNQCYALRVVPWMWSEEQSTVCPHVPALRHRLKKASA